MMRRVSCMTDPLPSPGESVRINCFALVAYIPGRLGEFLDELRRDLEPNSLAPRAHLTLLPPRPLCPGASVEEAQRYLSRALADVPAMELYLGNVEQFPITNVVFLAVDGGFLQMRKLHGTLNAGPLCYVEPFHYHPHVTLVQGVTSEQAGPINAEAARRWAEYRGPRQFTAESFCFVQNTSANRWLDLAEYSLRGMPAVR